ncbi:Hypothetical protein A7982_01608 [Minicystis rosea]|nr:Hypothetical protein A7982_01608 [Minicystis rosea]
MIRRHAGSAELDHVVLEVEEDRETAFRDVIRGAGLEGPSGAT